MHSYVWRNAEKKRYYNITVLNTREGYTVLCAWGSLVTMRRYKKTMTFHDDDNLQTYITYITKRRIRRGYILIATPNFDQRIRMAPTNPKAPIVLVLNEERATR